MERLSAVRAGSSVRRFLRFLVLASNAHLDAQVYKLTL